MCVAVGARRRRRPRVRRPRPLPAGPGHRPRGVVCRRGQRRRVDGRHPVQLRRGHRRHAGALAGRSAGARRPRGLRAVRPGGQPLRALRLGGGRLAPAGAARRALPRPLGRRVAPGRRRPALGAGEMERRACRLPNCRSIHRAVPGLCGSGHARVRRAPAQIRVVPGSADLQRFQVAASRPEARDRLGWPQDRRVDRLGAAAGAPHRRGSADRGDAGDRRRPARCGALRRRHRPAAPGAAPARPGPGPGRAGHLPRLRSRRAAAATSIAPPIST